MPPVSAGPYRLVDLQRWRGRRGFYFGLHPRVWPFDAGLADRALLALARAGADPERFVAAGFAARRDGGRGRVGGPGRFRESASALPGEACADSQS